MKKIFIPLLLSMFFALFIVSPTFAATSIGSVLVQPEQGWTRYNHDSSEITYLGGKWTLDPSSKSYNSTIGNKDTGIKFNFTGSKIRYISTTWSSGSSNTDVIIDGQVVGKINFAGPEVYQKKMMFEKTDLSPGEHSFELKNNGTNYIFFYGVDIEGTLKPFNLIDPTPVDPVPVDPTPNPDPTPTPDPTPSPNPDPSKPTEPTEPAQPTGDRAILTVTMDNGFDNEFDLSKKELNAFITWYDAKDAGRGASFFAIDKHNNNKGPFSNRKDYVIFNKILTFEVSEYSTK
jgi:hypothetical protein